jgi:4-hydroxyphenylpyruvate dioxygenase-like putative hemolysin
MRERGLQFLEVPKSYYTDIRERLKHSKVMISEDLDMVSKLMITVLLTKMLSIILFIDRKASYSD